MVVFSNSLLFSSKAVFLQISADFVTGDIREKQEFQNQVDVFFVTHIRILLYERFCQNQTSTFSFIVDAT